MTEDYGDESYEELLDEAEDESDDSDELREGQLDSYAGTYPEQREQQNLYNWFWKTVRLKKPFQLAKVGNLNSQEIGFNPVSVRDAMNLWVLGNTFKHPIFGNYFAQMAKITSATSMAKKGWFMELSISQKRVRQRSKSQSGEEWRVFNKNKK